jgi:dCTP diphosphatase
MMDDTTTIGELRTLVEEFVREREWEKFHRPKSLAMSIAIEAAELMELFQWPSDANAERLIKESRMRRAVTDELADVVIYCLAFANRTGIDLSSAVVRKLVKNRRKYPARRYRGRY